MLFFSPHSEHLQSTKLDATQSWGKGTALQVKQLTEHSPIIELDVRALRAQQRRQERYGKIPQLAHA